MMNGCDFLLTGEVFRLLGGFITDIRKQLYQVSSASQESEQTMHGRKIILRGLFRPLSLQVERGNDTLELAVLECQDKRSTNTKRSLPIASLARRKLLVLKRFYLLIELNVKDNELEI